MKKILMINGNPKEENREFDAYCEELADALSRQSNEVQIVKLREMKIGDCIGCYACWLKTPGICVLKDDQDEILKSYLWSDFVLLASPVIMGFVSADLKKMTDRMLPLLHPFIKLNNDRMGHYQRYDRDFPAGLLLEKKARFHGEDEEILKKVYANAVFIKTMDQEIKEVADEINGI